jgi:hypothetical protein
MSLRGRSWALALLVALWLVVVLSGFWALESYKARPGPSGEARAGAAPATGRPRLIFFAHPHCPCTRASLAEIGEIVSRPHGTGLEVVFVRPEGTADGWERGPLWEAAGRLPGASVRCDPGGAEARRLGAATSGHVVLLDAAGRVLFSGGVTRSRGHPGDSPGRRALLDRLSGAAKETWAGPVFGCPLFSPCESCPPRPR